MDVPIFAALITVWLKWVDELPSILRPWFTLATAAALGLTLLHRHIRSKGRDQRQSRSRRRML